MVAIETWVFLIYQLPREPSTPRISVWRKLKRHGVAQLGPGVVALPYDAATKEQLEWIAQEVTDSGGHATLWITTPTVQRFGRDLARTLAQERASEYRQLIARAESLLETETLERRRRLRGLRAELRRIERRDHFPPPERDIAHRALARLGAAVERAVSQ